MQLYKSLTAVSLSALLAAAPISALADRDESLPVDQLTKALESAVEAYPGQISEVEVDVKDGKKVVEVEIYGEDGQKKEVKVDGQSGDVIRMK